MKKLLFGLGLAAVLGASVANASNVDLFVRDMEYYWDVNKKSCEKTSFNAKRIVMRDYNEGNLLINKQYTNDAGRWTWLEGEDKDGPFSIDVFSTYGECKAYEKAIVRNEKIEDWNYFKNLKVPANLK